MPAFEVDARLSAVPDTTAFFIYFFSSLEGWYDRHVASSAQGFDVRNLLINWFYLLRTASWTDVQYLLPQQQWHPSDEV